MPTVLAVADSEMRAKATEVVNREILDEYSKQFNYDDIIHIEKDDQGNIVMLRADTLKMNRIGCDVALDSQIALNKLGHIGIKIPFNYIFRNNFLANIGPTLTVKMQPINNIETKYISQFESAGINQTRQRIYVQVTTDIRIILPFKSNELEVQNEIPISETIIVGKVPQTAISMDLQGTANKLLNATK